MTTIPSNLGATSGDTVLSPWQQVGDSHGPAMIENAEWVAEVEAKGYVRCSEDTCPDGCQGQTFGIVYHSAEYVAGWREEDLAKRKAVGVTLAHIAFNLNEHSQGYGEFLAAFAHARRWEWEPGDPVVAETFEKTIHRMLLDEGLLAPTS